jgi:hypothetical protein
VFCKKGTSPKSRTIIGLHLKRQALITLTGGEEVRNFLLDID